MFLPSKMAEEGFRVENLPTTLMHCIVKYKRSEMRYLLAVTPLSPSRYALRNFTCKSGGDVNIISGTRLCFAPLDTFRSFLKKRKGFLPPIVTESHCTMASYGR